MLARFVAAVLIMLPLIVAAHVDPPHVDPLPGESLAAELREEIRVLRVENDALRHRLGLPSSPTTPRPKRAAYSWKCEACGQPLNLADPLRPRHVDGAQGHPAKLSSADIKSIADGLRMSD